MANLTLDAVAKEAGVSKGGLLYHFPSKSSLITSIVERLAAHCEAEQNSAMTADASGAPGQFTRAYLMTRAEPPDPRDEPIHTAVIAAAGTDPQFLEPMQRRFVDWQKKIENDGIDPATATIVRLAIDGFCLCSLLGIPVPTGDFRRRILDQLLAMTRPETADAIENTDKTNTKG